jgi:hypothetical protein
VDANDHDNYKKILNELQNPNASDKIKIILNTDVEI